MLLNPADAESLGILSGQEIAVRNRCREITSTAKIDAGIRQGVISVPPGVESANVNKLTHAQHADPITGMALYSDIPVNVAPAN